MKGQGMGGQRRWLGLTLQGWRIGAPIIAVALLCFAYLCASGIIGFGWLSPAVSWVLNADPDKSPYRNFKDLVIFFGAAVALYFGYKRMKAADKQNENQTEAIRAQTAQIELSRRDQLSKRFTEAVKQLGDDKLAIRMGGIAGLWAVATESTHPEDRIMVLDVLCAFVRNAPRPEEGELQQIRPDVEMAMQRLGAEGPYFPWLGQEDGHEPYRRDFSGAYLEGSGFDHKNFDYACFDGCSINDIYWNNSSFKGAVFNDMLVINGAICKCILINSSFTSVSFYGFHFEGCRFKFSYFSSFKLLNSIFSDSYFNGVSLESSVISNSKILNSILFQFNFYRSSFEEFQVLSSCINECEFSEIQIDRFKFTGCDFTGSAFWVGSARNGEILGCELTDVSHDWAEVSETTWASCVYRLGAPPQGLPDDVMGQLGALGKEEVFLTIRRDPRLLNLP